jgi:hypothetical protein
MSAPNQPHRDTEVGTGEITGANPQAAKRRQEAHDRWWYICWCGHEHGRGEDFTLDCPVKSCDCMAYDHLEGKPDHPVNLQPFLTQPEADPEVPRCGGSGEVNTFMRCMEGQRGGDPCPGCPDCQPAPERRCPDDGKCHHACAPNQCFRVQYCAPLSEYGEEWRPEDVKRFGQPTPELLGEEAIAAIRELDEIAMAAWRAREALHLNLAELGKGLDPATTKNLADLVNDLNEHMPLGEDGHVWRMRKVVRQALAAGEGK